MNSWKHVSASYWNARRFQNINKRIHRTSSSIWDIQNGFSDVKIKIFHGEAAARTDSSHPFVSQVKGAADKIFGKSILNVSNAGTGPMYPFVDILKSPCISIGSTYMFSRIHSPNEFARVDLLKKTTKCICLIMENFGKN